MSAPGERRTRVELVHLEGRVENWIRFGRVAQEEILNRTRRAFWFRLGEVFAYVRWAANDYGTVVSRVDIVRTVQPHEPYTTVPGIAPGGEVLLGLSGWAKVEKVLQAIDALEAVGIAPEDVCPDHWRHIANRISTGLEHRAYTPERHRAWLLRKRVEGA